MLTCDNKALTIGFKGGARRKEEERDASRDTHDHAAAEIDATLHGGSLGFMSPTQRVVRLHAHAVCAFAFYVAHRPTLHFLEAVCRPM